MVDAHARQPIRFLSYCLLSNHWHFVVWPSARAHGDKAIKALWSPWPVDRPANWTARVRGSERPILLGSGTAGSRAP
jgi:hypothetical protein